MLNKTSCYLISIPIEKRIASKAFANCKKLHAVYIPNEVREISNDAFAGCTNLEYIFIPLGSITQFPKKIPSELWSKLYERNFSEVGKYRDTVPTRFTVPEILYDDGEILEIW